MPSVAVPVDIVCIPRGWRVCQHQPRTKPPDSPTPITDFIQFAQSQPDYISQYYLEIKLERSVLDIYNKMKESKKMILATDGGGGAIKYKGSIGFVLTTSDGTVLLSCFGQPAGLDLLSFRSEACVFLAATRLIIIIAQHYDKLITNAIDISCKMHLYTDSLSMIKKLKSMDAYPTNHLKYVMDSEWDILQALCIAMQKLTVPDTPVSKTTWYTPKEILKHTKKHTNDNSNIDTWIDSDLDTLTSNDTEERTSDTQSTDTPETHTRQSPLSVLTGASTEELPTDSQWTPPPTPFPKPSRWELEWVASHKDNNTTIDISTLPTGTQLNIKANKLATTGLRNLPMKPRVLLDPTLEVFLHHQGITITRGIRRTL